MRRTRILQLIVGLSTLLSLPAYAINPPQWEEFAGIDYIDSANVKTDGAIASAYVKHTDAGKQLTTLYEVDCKGDLIRVHSDTQRYRAVPVEGGGSVIQADDGFRTVVPGTRNAQIENAICGAVTRQEAESAKQNQQAECERAKHDDEFRVLLAKDQLSRDESMCLLGMVHGERYGECDKAAIPAGTKVVDYLRNKAITLPCEGAAAAKQP
jgi:hypothetical protein